MALTGAPRTSRADGSPAISWDAPAGCPDVGAVRAEVVRLVGGDPSAKVTDIRARVERRGESWHLRVTLRDDGRPRERTLTTDSCAAAARAAAFIVAIALEPTVGGLDPAAPSGSAPTPDSAPGPGPAPAPPGPAPAPGSAPGPGLVPAPPGPARDPSPGAASGPGLAPARPDLVSPGAAIASADMTAAVAEAPRDPATTRPPVHPDAPGASQRRRVPQGLVHLGPALQVGMAPVGVGLAAAAGLQWSRSRVTLGYVRWFPTLLRAAGRPEVGGELSVHAAALRVGPRLRAGPLELPLHLGLELGALRAVGLGGDLNFTRHALWAAALAGLGVAWAPKALRGRGALILTAEAALALHRPSFVFDDALELGRVGPAAFRGQLLVELRLP